MIIIIKFKKRDIKIMRIYKMHRPEADRSNVVSKKEVGW